MKKRILTLRRKTNKSSGYTKPTVRKQRWTSLYVWPQGKERTQTFGKKQSAINISIKQQKLCGQSPWSKRQETTFVKQQKLGKENAKLILLYTQEVSKICGMSKNHNNMNQGRRYKKKSQDLNERPTNSRNWQMKKIITKTIMVPNGN